MLPRIHRLRRSADFVRLRHVGGSQRGNALLLRSLVDRVGAKPRIGIIIAKKTVAKAVDRNAIRRKIRSIIASLLPLLLRQTVAVIIVGKNARALSSASLRSELSGLFRRARLLP